MHLNGLGTARSCPVGAQFLKAVAERGTWGALLEEAHAALDHPAARDSSVSLQFYAYLAEGGFELAQANVAFLLDQQFTHDHDTPLLGLQGASLAERALHMYRQAAAQGNTDAEVKLGDYSYYGYGTDVDLEAAVAHYRTAADARSAQAMFNLAYMYAHGQGLATDYHLAKRHYDLAAETSSEAWAPVQIALMELKVLVWWQAQTGGSLGDPYDYVSALLAPLNAVLAPAVAPLAEIEEDTILILVLCAALGGVLVLRQQQQTH